MAAVSASQARRELFPLIAQVNDEHEPVEITSKAGNAVLMSAADYAGWRTTLYLFANPVNARRLIDSIDAARGGRVEPHDLVDDE